jgi:hypothetical protein
MLLTQSIYAEPGSPPAEKPENPGLRTFFHSHLCWHWTISKHPLNGQHVPDCGNSLCGGILPWPVDNTFRGELQQHPGSAYYTCGEPSFLLSLFRIDVKDEIIN